MNTQSVTFGALFLTFLLIAIYANEECPPHPFPSNGYSECSNGRKHRSLCKSKCDRGFRMVGLSQMLCWCKNGRCTWKGRKAKCEKEECEYPDLESGSLRFIDSWKGGFGSVIEFEDQTLKKADKLGWSIVIVFDRPLGKKATLSAWNMELTATSTDSQTFTFVNPKEKARLSKSVDSMSRFASLIVVENMEGDQPESAFAGLYFRRVRDASCLMAPTMPLIRPLYSRNVQTPTSTSKPVKITPTPSIGRGGKELATESITDSVDTATGINEPEYDTTESPSMTTDSLEEDEIFCKAQTHLDSYVAERGWEDRGNHHFGGYFNLVYPEQLPNWRMVVSFQEKIQSIQTWACQVLESSEDGLIWTFGPHPWSTALHGGRTVIRYIATQAYATVESPLGHVFLCSESFTEGDAIIKGSGLGLSPPDGRGSIYPPTTIPYTEISTVEYADSGIMKCSARDPSGRPVIRAPQTSLNFKPNNEKTKYNYNEIIHKSLLFYEAQRSGHLPPDNRIPWRGDSALKDGCDIKRDLTGGWFDAGDAVKFNFPMAYTLTTLAWGAIEFKEAYQDAGELENMIKTIKWGTQYFIKTHISKNKLVAQVGHGQTDHNFWGRPEEMKMNRPTYILTEEKPGSDLSAEVAAALAASSIFLRDTDPDLAESAISHAKEIYQFAKQFRAKYSDSVPDAALYYKSYSGFQDELVWGAVWMHKATNDSGYLKDAEKMYAVMGAKNLVAKEYSWDDKILGAQVLLTEITGKEDYRKPLTLFFNGLPRRRSTPAGLYYIGDWGTNRYAANAALILIMGTRLSPPLPRRAEYLRWANKQIGLLLGDEGRSFVVGFGKNPPLRAHHGASSCPPYPERCDWSTYHSPKPNHYILYGALVGGPNLKGIFNDSRSYYQESEVACDYNAGFQSAVAGLKLIAMEKRKKTALSPSIITATTTPTTTISFVSTVTSTTVTSISYKTSDSIALTTQARKSTKDPNLCRPRRSKRCVKARRAAKKAAGA